MEISSFVTDEPKNIDVLAVAIRCNRHGGTHTGFFYRKSSKGPVCLCHLEGHYKLTDETADDKYDYFWVRTDLNRTVQKNIASFIGLIIKNKDVVKIPYGFLRHGLSFDNNGVYQATNPGDGLTCATFVLDVITKQKLNVLEPKNWPPLAEDDPWRVMVLESLKSKTDINPLHIKALEKGTGIRFKPQEVFAGFGTDHSQWPIAFPDLDNSTKEVMQTIAA